MPRKKRPEQDKIRAAVKSAKNPDRKDIPVASRKAYSAVVGEEEIKDVEVQFIAKYPREPYKKAHQAMVRLAMSTMARMLGSFDPEIALASAETIVRLAACPGVYELADMGYWQKLVDQHRVDTDRLLKALAKNVSEQDLSVSADVEQDGTQSALERLASRLGIGGEEK